MANDRVVLLTADGAIARIACHALRDAFPGLSVVCEERVSRQLLMRRRVEKLGPWTVFGQALFMTCVAPILTRNARGRIDCIVNDHGLRTAALPDPVHRVSSVNAPETQNLLRAIDPAVVVVVGTRIISRRTLSSVDVPFINVHAGITPLYRGVHGGYWAIADGKPELAGVTVHLVDYGIDTGLVIAQATVNTTNEDCFVTYPYLQMAAARPLLIDAVRHALDGTLQTTRNPRCLPSKLRTHPTIWRYLWLRASQGVK